MEHGLMIKLLRLLNHLVLKTKIAEKIFIIYSMALYFHEVTHDHITNK